MHTRYTEVNESTYAASSNRTLVVGPGEIEGDLALSLYDNERFGGPAGATLVRFSFRDANNVGRQYSTVLHPLAFWPEQSDRASLSEQPKQYDFALKATLDDRTEYLITFDDGAPLVGVRKYQGFAARMQVLGAVIRVYARINTEDPRAFQGFLNFVYDVPLHRILWRRATRSTGSDLLIEDEPFVLVENVPAPRGISPSPVLLR